MFGGLSCFFNIFDHLIFAKDAARVAPRKSSFKPHGDCRPGRCHTCDVLPFCLLLYLRVLKHTNIIQYPKTGKNRNEDGHDGLDTVVLDCDQTWGANGTVFFACAQRVDMLGLRTASSATEGVLSLRSSLRKHGAKQQNCILAHARPTSFAADCWKYQMQ